MNHKKTITHIGLVILYFLLPIFGYSTHIVGGTFAYNVLSTANGIASVEVTLFLYRDDNGGAQFDQNINLGLYKYQNSEYEFVLSQSVVLSSSSSIQIMDPDGCPTNMINYEIGTYVTQMDVPLQNYEHFKFAYQRCCRDNSTSNIRIPEETGIAISFDLYPKAFTIFQQTMAMNIQFPALLEVGKASTFDLSIEDDYEKDYYLSIPKTAGGVLGTVFGDPFDCEGITPDVSECLPEFSDVEYIDLDNPYGFGATVEIDNESGALNVEIPQISKVLVGVTLDRYEEGALFSRLRQQFLINSVDCSISNTNENSKSIFKSWPIPSTGTIYFDTPLQQISIQNINGTILNFNKKEKFSQQIDMENFSEGIYFLKGQTKEGNWISQRLMILK